MQEKRRHTYMYIDVHSSIIFNSQKPEIIQNFSSVIKWVSKLCISYKKIVYSNENERTTTTCNSKESHTYNVQGNKPN